MANWTTFNSQNAVTLTQLNDNLTLLQTGLPSINGTAGTASAYTLTLIPALVAPYTLYQTFRFIAHVTSNAGATLNINGVGAVPLFDEKGQALGVGQIQAGDACVVWYTGAGFQLYYAPSLSRRSASFQANKPANTTTIDVSQGCTQVVADSIATTVTAITNAIQGQELRLVFTNANTTIQNNASISLQGGVNFAGSSTSILRLYYDGAVWREESRRT